MDKNEQLERGVIPKGTHVQIMGCRITLLEDTKVDSDQKSLDYILKVQEDFDNGVGVMGSAIPPSKTHNSN